GFWLAERAWEPLLPEVLDSANSEYTLVDDIAFESAGMSEGDCFEPYQMESRGKFVAAFPILKKLRYYIPFKSVSLCISYLKAARKAHLPIAVYGDDGEKFGAWPTTFDRVYTQGWLDSFFQELTKNVDWLETVKLSEYLKLHPPSKRIYLPACAYSEMMEWSIPMFGRKSRDAKRRVPLRGYWRLFLAKYPESARMYAKMLRVSSMLSGGNTLESELAQRELWKGQCNDAYWHGVFGGLYAPLLRKITYEHLIRAQFLYEKEIMKEKIRVSESHISGSKEIVVDSTELEIVVSPLYGGSITEIDFKTKSTNVTDTLSRREERYHKNIKKHHDSSIVPQSKKARSIHDSPRSKKGLEALLVYDRYPKFSFLDHIVPIETKMDSFTNQTYDELANLMNSRYEARIQKSNHSVSVILSSRSSLVNGAEMAISKSIQVGEDQPHLTVNYDLSISPGGSNGSISALFIPEINLGSLADQVFSENYSRAKKVKGHSLQVPYPENEMMVEVVADEVTESWILPIKTVSQSERGFESILQGVSILPRYEIELDSSKRSFSTSIGLAFN
ncbi:MAG: alpha-amylase/4-alpha-glucanotransferase domain-containing protein, partial [Nitrososphaerales archaeon]